MAGLYIHIPFCRQVCRYCDFHFSVNTSKAEDMIKAIGLEIMMRKNYLGSQRFDTVYFGGGTPSLLTKGMIGQLFDTLHQSLSISSSCEVTLEANPDDLDGEKLSMYRDMGINRLSIGVQSFSNMVLTLLNRSHNAATALHSISLARKAGFDNINIDLMYAIPGQGHEVCMTNIEKVLRYSPEHISVYALTIEEKTVFGRWKSRQRMAAVDEEESTLQGKSIANRLEQAGYQHYEISNFCRPGFHAIHNSNYWKQVPYLGVGPGAHSFDSVSRQWNICNNTLYMDAIRQRRIPCQKEVLSMKDRINECIFTSLRTSWGCDVRRLQAEYGISLRQLNKDYLKLLSTEGMVILDKDRLVLTRKGKWLADDISARLFVVEDI